MVRIIFLIIISISTCYSVALENVYDNVFYTKFGDSISSDYKESENSCTVITNANESFHLEDQEEDSKKLPNGIFINDWCEFGIIVNTNYTGSWTFKTDREQEKIYIFGYEKKNEDEIPEHISASFNASVLQWIPSDSTNITSCHLIHGFRKNEEMKYLIHDLYQTIHKDDVKLFGKCGVRLKATHDNVGDYHLYATIGNGSAISSQFSISINEAITASKTQYINETILRGTRNHIISHGSINSMSKYCTITDPRRNVIHIENDSCEYKIPLVTSYHHGMWILRKFDSDQNEVFDYQYNLTVVDDILRMKVNVTYEKDSITILCNTTSQHVIQTCKFINPSDEYINVGLGMSTEKYEYYGESFGKPYVHQECGIIVHNLNKFDFGTWKCIMTTENELIIDSLVHIPGNTNEIKISTKTPNVIDVVENSPFVIRCSANRRLSYCWLQSPNGTIYFVGKENLESNTLQYEGLGLDMGECGAKVLNGSKSYHHGVWKCHIGIENGPDLQTLVNIQVFDSTAIPVQDKIEVSSGDDEINLSVTAISGSEFDADSCKWVSPTGALILQNYDSQYVITSNKSSCNLEIRGDNQVEHIGQWTCIISHGGDDIKVFVEVVSLSYNTWWIFLIIAILACIAFLIAFHFIIKMAKNVMKKDNLLFRTSSVSTDDPPYIRRTQI